MRSTTPVPSQPVTVILLFIRHLLCESGLVSAEETGQIGPLAAAKMTLGAPVIAAQLIYQRILERFSAGPVQRVRLTIPMTSGPYASSLARPMPGMDSRAALSVGRRSAIASRVASEKITNAGTDASVDRDLRHKRSASTS